jgi:hypothetical protein
VAVGQEDERVAAGDVRRHFGLEDPDESF